MAHGKVDREKKSQLVLPKLLLNISVQISTGLTTPPSNSCAHAERMVLGCAKQSKLESCVEMQFELRLLTDSSPHCSDADGKQELDGDAERHL